MAILASTKFLYRAEPGGPPAEREPGAAYAISDLELAWRLSFFLWSQGPDEELLALAKQRHAAASPRCYERQVAAHVRRSSARRSLVTNFAFQWLGVRRLEAIDPDPRLYPNFDEDLRRAFERRDGALPRQHPARRAPQRRRSADGAVHVRQRAARAPLRHRRACAAISFAASSSTTRNASGLFGKGSVLMVTSYPDRTSPVLRGAWIMEHLLGSAAESAAAGRRDGPGARRRRAEVGARAARAASHAASCNHCHGVIDPLGQALENFNAIGEWRVRERDSGVRDRFDRQLATGLPVNSPEELREALAAEPELFVQALTENLLTYALGPPRRVLRHARRARASWRIGRERLYVRVDRPGRRQSMPFRMREAPELANETVAAGARQRPARAPEED